jgi:hypothetical protein
MHSQIDSILESGRACIASTHGTYTSYRYETRQAKPPPRRMDSNKVADHDLFAVG